MKNKSREQKNNRLGSVSSSSPRNQLKNIKVKAKAHEHFMIDCIKNDMNQDEMFEEYQKVYHEEKLG